MPEIKCLITECTHNNDVKCGAPMIQVDYNGAVSAAKSDQTKCETFKRKS